MIQCHRRHNPYNHVYNLVYMILERKWGANIQTLYAKHGNRQTYKVNNTDINIGTQIIYTKWHKLIMRIK